MVHIKGLLDGPEPDEQTAWSFEEKLKSKLTSKFQGSVDLRPYSSPRHNQGPTGSCVAQSVCKALEIKRIMEKGRGGHVDLSRLAVYYHARLLMGVEYTQKDLGTHISLAFNAARRFGIPPESAWPWDQRKLFASPSWSAMREAYVAKIEAFYKIKSTGQDRLDNVCAALRAGNPVVYGCNVDSSWHTYRRGSDPLTHTERVDRIGRHATVIVGYKDGLFIGENSWGSSWGLDGFYLMRPSILTHADSRDFWVPQMGWETYGE